MISSPYYLHVQQLHINKMIRKEIITIILLFFSYHVWNQNPIVQEVGISPIMDLVQRIAPEHACYFVFKLEKGDRDVFKKETKDEKVIISGNNYNSLAVGFNHYLKNYCKTYVSWYSDDKVELPKKLPEVPSPMTRVARIKNRFFLNYCTFGYTMPWWQWKDWERFIDWMALNGITLPLAITGQEAIWYEVWQELGLDDEQIRSYFTGPAYLPWHRMSNLDKWGGPLPMSWLQHQKELQKKIVERERELGMTPVLPAFAGHVPEALKDIFPKAKINRLSSWGGFEDTYCSFFLDPIDPLFKEIQSRFLSKQIDLYGTDHIYGADPFNEVHPPSWEPDYLATVANTIYTSMVDVDTYASWLQMSWIFYFERDHWTNERIKAMITAVPKGKMKLLDYFCENQEVWKMTDSFFGQPFLWNYLGNFGGNTMLVGNLDEVESRMENAFQNSADNLWGIDSTLEALDVNPLMYVFVFEKAWLSGSVDTKSWIKEWAESRAGNKNDGFEKAWELLYENIYQYSTALGQATLTNARPTLTGSGNWTTNPDINYDNNVLFKAWQFMLENPSETRQTYAYDVVNIGRQFLGNHFRLLRDGFSQNYYDRDLGQLKEKGEKILELLDDLDRLLATEQSFLLGKWLENAKDFGVDEDEKKYYEHNARNILTTWGNKAQSLNDYANRSWAGLTKDYYKKRWEMFVCDVVDTVEDNREFDADAFFEKVTQFEWDWTFENKSYEKLPEGNAFEIGRELIEKYDSSKIPPKL